VHKKIYDNSLLNSDLHSGTGRLLSVDYLRSFITVLVVAHHSTLAYKKFARFSPHAYIFSALPVMGRKRRIALDIFENFKDVFFMGPILWLGLRPGAK
jgi:glucan biosynthesis protein C